jgi:hypothetical protein
MDYSNRQSQDKLRMTLALPSNEALPPFFQVSGGGNNLTADASSCSNLTGKNDERQSYKGNNKKLDWIT